MQKFLADAGYVSRDRIRAGSFPLDEFDCAAEHGRVVMTYIDILMTFNTNQRAGLADTQYRLVLLRAAG
jgi:hypothetical protein